METQSVLWSISSQSHSFWVEDTRRKSGPHSDTPMAYVCDQNEKGSMEDICDRIWETDHLEQYLSSPPWTEGSGIQTKPSYQFPRLGLKLTNKQLTSTSGSTGTPSATGTTCQQSLRRIQQHTQVAHITQILLLLCTRLCCSSKQLCYSYTSSECVCVYVCVCVRVCVCVCVYVCACMCV